MTAHTEEKCEGGRREEKERGGCLFLDPRAEEAFPLSRTETPTLLYYMQMHCHDCRMQIKSIFEQNNLVYAVPSTVVFAPGKYLGKVKKVSRERALLVWPVTSEVPSSRLGVHPYLARLQR